MKRCAYPWLAAVLLLALCSTAAAAPVRVTFGGTIDTVEVLGDAGSLLEDLGSSVAAGGSFWGFFVYDDAQPEAIPDTGLFLFPTPPVQPQIFLGDVLATGADLRLLLQPGSPPIPGLPNLGVTSAPLDFASVAAQGGLEILLIDPSGSFPTSTDLPDLAWDLSPFAYRGVTFRVYREDELPAEVLVRGTLRSLAELPEPAAALLLAFAGVALAAHFRGARR